MLYLSKDQIINASVKIFDTFTQVCTEIDERTFFKRPSPEKWSVAENIQHLIVSTNTTTLAYILPAFIVRWIGGTPNRDSRSYEALVERYKEKLAAGGRASGRFIPKPVDIKCGKDQLLQNWKKAGSKFITALNNSSESKLDDYLARHPLLGRITLRELCYFTIYHTEHHLNIINGIINPTLLNPKPE
ncbi:MAG: DinB family protein [Chitinophagaceae bacterium]|nr:DinB family protein [Chitinophagaceae bacterium]